MKLLFYNTIALLLFVTGANAQYDSPSTLPIRQIFAVSWEISLPAGSNGLISKTSLAGGRIEYRKFLSREFSVGLGFSWNSFDQHFASKTYEKPDGSVAVTTDMIRQAYTAPITAIAHYYPAVDNKMFKPYIGIGMGGQYSEKDIYYNIYVTSNNDWGFVVRPEIGTLVVFSHEVSGLLTFSYNYSTNKIEALGINSLSQFGINIGIAGLF